MILTKKDIQAIAAEVVRLMKEETDGWCTSKEAARMFGVSEQTIRKNKDYYVHTKRGGHKQGQLLYLRSSLIDYYRK